MSSTALATRQLSVYEDMALAGSAAIISKTIAAPVECVKLLLQNQEEMIRKGRLDQPYKGMADCVARTYRGGGVLRFWKGNFTNCLRYFPTQALNFAIMNRVRAQLKPLGVEPFHVQLAKNIASGGVAGMGSAVLVYHLDFARTRLAADEKAIGSGKREFSGLLDVYRKTIKAEGVRGLYRGFVVSCVGVIPYRGVYFGLYNQLCPLLPEDAGMTAHFLVGYGSTVVAGLVGYPMDTVRRRMMMTAGTEGNTVRYRGSWDCARSIWVHEGPAAFMKGASANIIRGIGGAGVLAGFDKFKEYYVAYTAH